MGEQFKDLAKRFSLIKLNGKQPIEKEWQKCCQIKRSFEEIGFRDGDNAGIACGSASGVIAVDVDDPGLFEKACKKNNWNIPETRTHQTGSGNNHYLFKYPNGSKNYGNKSFKKFGFDIRGNGGQIVAPGSIHPDTDKPYRVSNPAPLAEAPKWLLSLYELSKNDHRGEGPGANIDIDSLPVSRNTLNLITNGKPVGERSEAVMTVLNALVGAGLKDSEIIDIFKKNPIGEKFYEKKKEERELWLLSQIEKAHEWIENAKPKINADCQNLPKITSQAWIALRKYNDPPRIFHHASGIVRVSKGADKVPGIVTVRKDALRHELARASKWFKDAKKGKMETYPSTVVCRDMLVHPEPPLPQLERLIHHPIYSNEGILHINGGYSKNTKCYLVLPRNLVLQQISNRPKQSDVTRAKDLFENLLSDFPFTSQAEKAHSIGLLILPFIRPMIAGPTPLHIIEAPSPGTGKTLLAQCLSYPSTNGELQVLTEGKNEDEWRKRITSVLRKQTSFLLIDNVQGRLESPALASALTLTLWTDRILGQSNIVSLKIRCGWIATGNNPLISPEIARRTIRIRLDAKTEKPWLRPADQFSHPNLINWVERRRGELIWAALTLIQAWIAEERPQPEDTITLGMFEDWSARIGGILHVANIPGFLDNVDEFYDSTDHEDPALKRLINYWWKIHRSSPVKASELLKIINDLEIPLDLGGGDSERGQRISFGKYLQRLRDRQIGEFRIVPGKVKHKSQTWRLEPSPSFTTGDNSETSPEYPHEKTESNQEDGEKGDVGDVFKTDKKIEK